MRFFHGTNIDFVGKRGLFFNFSLVLIALSLVVIFVLKPQFGIDFEGGTEIAVEFNKAIGSDDLRNTISDVGFGGSEIKSFGGGNKYLIRVKDSENAPDMVKNAIIERYGADFKEVLKVDKIGPKIGREMKEQAFIAIILSVLAILLYIAFRFEFVFGLGAIVALLHDVLITFAIIVALNATGLFDLEINQAILAAMLTVVGFSINDTVIIFDRIRENKEKYKGKNFIVLVNQSINETLSRTVNTVFTAVCVLLTIVIFGGPVLQGFALTMLLGIIAGTYSSIFIASSFVIWYLEKVKKMDLAKGYGKLTGFKA